LKKGENMAKDIKSQVHLINILQGTKDHHPNFTLFLGAGASATSGVKTSKEIIKEWRESFKKNVPEEKLEDMRWYNRPEEYSQLFELLYDQPSQRREYIESCLKNAEPSWGYIYLVNLLRKSNPVFNTVFTTNFDDLLNEACYLFSSDVRPLVCAHDSSVRNLRITSKRPKIIKLHGDFLFDDIKNTARELESLENNMRDKFKQYAPEFGMIVVGYAGNDRSVMDNINTLLRTEDNYPHGVYWCVRSNDEISQNVTDLERFPSFRLVEIQGFDELFADINSALELNLQPEMIDPYKAMSARLNSLVKSASVPDDPDKIHPAIKRDIEQLASKIKEQTTERKDGETNIIIKTDGALPEPPLQLLAEAAYRSEAYGDARNYINLQLESSKPDTSAYSLGIKILTREWDKEFADKIFESIKANCARIDYDECTLMALDLINIKKYTYADELLGIGYTNLKQQESYSAEDEEIYVLNKAQMKRHQGIELDENELFEIKGITNSNSRSMQMGANILLEKYEEALEILEDIAFVTMLEWPIIKLFPTRYETKLTAIRKKVDGKK